MIQYKGGDGSSKEQSIIILGANSDAEGVEAEYEYLESLYGKQGVEWRLLEQALFIKDEKYYDILEIEFRDQSKMKFWFDINDFYGREDE